MALIPEWYDENISTAAFLGPCATPNWEQVQDIYVESDIRWLHDNGIYVLNYSGDSWEETKEFIMAEGPPGIKALVGAKTVLWNVPVQGLEAYCQASQTQRFQEYSDDWNWQVPPHTPLMDFGKVKEMKVALYVGLFDRTCPVTQAENIRKQLGESTVVHYVVAPWQGHSPWGLSQGEWFVNDMAETLMINADL